MASTYFPPQFAVGTQIALTEDTLLAAGFPASVFTGVTIELSRRSATGKWHTPGNGWNRCQHLGGYGRHDNPIPVQRIPVLGERDGCRHCYRVALDGPLAVMWQSAQLVVQAQRWVSRLEHNAPTMTWLDVARWTMQTPFTDDPMPQLLQGLAGAKGFAGHRRTVLRVWNQLCQRTSTAVEVAHQSAGPPGLRALAARARDIVASQRETIIEARALSAIAGAPTDRFYGRDPLGVALDGWLTTIASDGDAAAARHTLGALLDNELAAKPVRDVSLLPHPGSLPGGMFCSPAAWAQAEFQLMIKMIGERWCDRLEGAVHTSGTSATDVLLLVLPWPIIGEPDRELAYLTQYPVLGTTVAQSRDGYGHRDRVPWAAVLQVPSFAAEHAAAHRSDTLITRPGPPVTGQPTDRHAVRSLLRIAAAYLPEDAHDDPAELAEIVREHRAGLTHLRAHDALAMWAESGAPEYEMPRRWTWIPATPDDGRQPTLGLAALGQIVASHYLSKHVEIQLAAGPSNALEVVTITAHLRAVDPEQETISYVPQPEPACPPVPVPLRRLISLTARD